MKIYENTRIRVTLTEEQSQRFNHSRGEILSHAMAVLGNRSERAILETETISNEDVEQETIEELTYQYLSEHCRYNLNNVLMRMYGGYRMSEGMQADVSAAKMYARSALINNPKLIEIGKKSLQLRANEEKRYRQSRANSNWKIEIIGEMPKQIGMCRYGN